MNRGADIGGKSLSVSLSSLHMQILPQRYNHEHFVPQWCYSCCLPEKHH